MKYEIDYFVEWIDAPKGIKDGTIYGVNNETKFMTPINTRTGKDRWYNDYKESPHRFKIFDKKEFLKTYGVF